MSDNSQSKADEEWWDEINYKQLTELLRYIPISEMYDKDGNSSLHYIAKSDNDFIAEKLIEAGCDVDHKNERGETALTIAVINKNSKVANVLLSSGAKCIDTNFKNNRTLLHIAARNGSLDTVQLLISTGADVNAVDADGRTPLHEAILIFAGIKTKNKSEIVELLIQAKSNVNAKDEMGASPLHYAINNKFMRAFEMLVSAGADINAKDSEGQSLLHLAVESNNLHFAKRLIKLGIDLNSMNSENLTCVHWAATHTYIKMLELLLNNGASANCYDPNSYDPLCYYLRGVHLLHMIFRSHYDGTESYDKFFERQFSKKMIQHSTCLELLLKHGAVVNRVNKDQMTPIYIVLSNTHLHTNWLRLLLKNGATFDFDHPIVQELSNECNGPIYRNMLIRHQALFDAQGRNDGPRNFNLEKLKNQERKYYARCRDEIELLKNSPIGETRVTLFHILVDQNIGPYARIKNVESLFDTLCNSKNFPLYKDVIVERFTKEMKKQRLITKAIKGLSRVFRWNEYTHRIIFDYVISYLSEKDLYNLIIV